jgi:hypothetical protein
VAKVGEWAAKLKGCVDKLWEWVAKQGDRWPSSGMGALWAAKRVALLAVFLVCIQTTLKNDI